MTMHKQVSYPTRFGSVLVDAGIVDTLKPLWDAGIKTISSCEGWPGQGGFVVVRAEDADRAQALIPGAQQNAGYAAAYQHYALLEWSPAP